MNREKLKRVRMIKTSDMKREEKHKVGQEFIVEWCKKHKIEINAGMFSYAFNHHPDPGFP